MSSHNISQEVLKKIKEEQIKPRPKWQFLMKDYFVWTISIVSLLIGGLAVAVITYMVDNNDWDIYEHVSDSFLEFALVSLPYFWILFLGLFILLANYHFKHTKVGYRYCLHTIVLVSVGASVALGTLFYHIGLGAAMEDAFANSMPMYTKLEDKKKKVWTQPEKGLLSGTVTEVQTPQKFKLKDFEDNIWIIHGDNVIMLKRIKIQAGRKVKVVGEQINEIEFKAFKIHPWILRKHPREKMKLYYMTPPPQKQAGQLQVNISHF